MTSLWVGALLLFIVSIASIFVYIFSIRAWVSEGIFHLPDNPQRDNIWIKGVYDSLWKSLVLEMAPSIIGISLLIIGYRNILKQELSLDKFPLVLLGGFLLWLAIIRIGVTLWSLRLTENASLSSFSEPVKNLVLQIHIVWLLTDVLIILAGTIVIGIVIDKTWREMRLRTESLAEAERQEK